MCPAAGGTCRLADGMLIFVLAAASLLATSVITLFIIIVQGENLYQEPEGTSRTATQDHVLVGSDADDRYEPKGNWSHS